MSETFYPFPESIVDDAVILGNCKLYKELHLIHEGGMIEIIPTAGFHACILIRTESEAANQIERWINKSRRRESESLSRSRPTQH